jgi:TM2 domain-containing membrane protein YozV
VNTFNYYRKHIMETKYRTAIEFIGACILKGILYGAISGTVTGLFVFLIGAVFGLPLGASFGALFGAVNGVVLWDLDSRRGLRHNDRREAGIRGAACMITSFVLLLIITGLSYLLNPFLIIYCLLALPGVLVSAAVLANWATKQHPTMRLQYYPPTPIDDQPATWPPAPRVDGGYTQW